LNWTVKLLVSRIGPDGSAAESIAEASAQVGRLGLSSVPVDGPLLTTPGSYRIDSTFSDANGNLLGSYFEYIQVVPDVLKVRLGISRRSVSPGGAFKIRMENLGTRHVSYGAPYVLERYFRKHWRRVPQKENFFAVKYGLLAGQVGGCQTVHLFKDAVPGRYRIRKRVSSGFRKALRTRFLDEVFYVRKGAAGPR
jgi:hypothetical protein